MRPILALLVLFGAATTAAAQQAPLPGTPRVGLVLGGGGAKGFAHVGVLQVLEENRIPVHAISGTSMGAVVGSLYAAGDDAARITAVTREIPWQTLFDDSIARKRLPFRRKRDERDILINYRVSFDDNGLVLPKGVLRGQDLFLTLAEYLAQARAVENFDNLAIPFRAVATDIVAGKQVVMSTGDIATAVFASMSVPGGLPPVERDGKLLVDGMLVDNLPVDVARRMGVDSLIVVDVSAPLRKRDEITSFISILDQMQLMLGRDAIDRQLKSLGGSDVLIAPDVHDIGATAFERSEDGIARGRAAALAVLDRLRPLALPEDQWQAYLAARTARAPRYAPKLAFVKLENRSDLPDKQIDDLITTRPGQRLDAARMTDDLRNVYALGAFRAVRYGIGPGPGGVGEGVTILAEGDPSAANWLQLGLGIATDFDRQSDLVIGLAYTDRNFLGTGAEWRTDLRVGTDLLMETALYKEFGRSFVEGGPFWTRVDTSLFVGGVAIAEVRNERVGAKLDGGLLFGNWGEVRLGATFAAVNLETKIGESLRPDNKLQDTSFTLQFTADTLDQLNYPASGIFARVAFTDHVGVLGGDFSYAVFSGRVFKPISLGSTTVVLSGEFGTTSEGDGRQVGDFRLGGFLNLTGLQPNELVGRHKLLGRAIVYHRLGEEAPILDFPLYVGGSLEVGNSWVAFDEIGFDSLRVGGSLFLSADTPLGPMTFAAGATRGGSAVYLILGRIF
jgi:NTE family protein